VRRRPSRGPLPPPPLPRNERFELPIAPMFLDEPEEVTEHRQRTRAVRRTARRFFGAVSDHLGNEEARKLFEGLFRKRREGRPSGTRDPKRDARLLEEYDDRKRKITSEEEISALPRVIAEEADKRYPGQLGSSAPAIEKQLRRLLSKRGWD
jgi:hypothetical protein